jgi:hypothetical protein
MFIVLHKKLILFLKYFTFTFDTELQNIKNDDMIWDNEDL